jgi:DnaJ-domain-containing protein 1
MADPKNGSGASGASAGLDSKTLQSWSDAELDAELAKRRLARARSAAAASGAPLETSGRVERALAADRDIAQAYANLELPKGAPIEDVEKKYKELAAKYAPEKHASDPQRSEIAQQLRAQLTRAYDRLTAYLKR